MTISMGSVFPVLASAISAIEPSEEDLRECAPYFFLSDIRHVVCQRAGSGAVIEMDQFAALLEKLALEGDGDVQDLVMDALEGLLECDLKNIIAARFGPKVRQMWSSVVEQTS